MSPTIIVLSNKSSPAWHSLQHPGSVVVCPNDCTVARNGVSVRVPRVVFLFVVAVTAHPGAIVASAELADLLYGDDADGGPDLAANTINTVAMRARPALAALGYRLENSPRLGRWVRCCLSPLPVTYGELAADQEMSHAQQA